MNRGYRFNLISIGTAKNQRIVHISPNGTDQCHGDAVRSRFRVTGFQAVKAVAYACTAIPYSLYKWI